MHPYFFTTYRPAFAFQNPLSPLLCSPPTLFPPSSLCSSAPRTGVRVRFCEVGVRHRDRSIHQDLYGDGGGVIMHGGLERGALGCVA